MSGYAGKILHCDLSLYRSTTHATSDYASMYLGGRGMAARLYWQFADFSDPSRVERNPLVITTGPLTGFPGLAASRWQICARSPGAPNTFNYGSLGGGWGVRLKQAGYDGLVITGVADRPVYLEIRDGRCEFHAADHLRGQSTAAVISAIKSEIPNRCSVLVTGPAGENLVPFATIIVDDGSSCSSGFGAVMGSKNLCGIAVGGSNRIRPAKPSELTALVDFLKQLKGNEPLEPLNPPPGVNAKRLVCHGCIAGCGRMLFSRHGRHGKYLCVSGLFYEDHAHRYYGVTNEVPFLATRLCDDLTLDTNVISTMTDWLYRCHMDGIITDKMVDLPLSEIGSYDFIRELTAKITSRRGSGEILAHGTLHAATVFGQDALSRIPEYVFSDSTFTGYCPRAYTTNAMIFATEPRQPYPVVSEVGRTVIRWLPDSSAGASLGDDVLRLIARNFWGSEAAADLTNYTGKALASKLIQDRHCVRESVAVCSFSWHVSSIECFRPQIISEILTAVTGVEYSQDKLLQIGERIFNLQRAILVRETGQGRQRDQLPDHWFRMPLQESFLNPELLVPGPGQAPVSRRGAVLDREQINHLADEYYHLRGWDVETGLQTGAGLAGLGLSDVSAELTKSNLTR